MTKDTEIYYELLDIVSDLLESGVDIEDLDEKVLEKLTPLYDDPEQDIETMYSLYLAYKNKMIERAYELAVEDELDENKKQPMKKLVYESLNEFLNEDGELFKGEKQIGITAKDVDPKELLIGMAVEAEHSTDIAVQEHIALQHLAENPKYYSEGIKKGMFDEVAAINLYKKYFLNKENPIE